MEYLFVRIPRTASTSICKALDNYPDHKRASDWKKRLENKWDSLFKFTIVRNPYTRFASMSEYFHVPIKDFEKDQRFIPQMSYLDKPIDFIGRFEELNKSWNTICKRLGINKVPLEHLKESRSKPTLTDEMKEIIYKYYEQDFIQLSYNK